MAMTLLDDIADGVIESVVVTPGRPAMYYLNPDAITGDDLRRPGRTGETISGYGSRIPTWRVVKVRSRWHRVRAMAYGNSSTPYVIRHGRQVFIR